MIVCLEYPQNKIATDGITSRKTGYAAKKYERRKIKQLKKLRMVTGEDADTVIIPVIFERTGGAYKGANKLLQWLAAVQLPGAKGERKEKADKRLARRRALFIMNERKHHSFMIARVRAQVMLSKREKIRGQRALKVAKVESKDGRDVFYHRVGVAPLDADAPLDGVRDVFDLGDQDIAGPTHLTPNDCELEALLAEQEAAVGGGG